MQDRNLRKVRHGRVVSDKMNKTIVVAVESFTSHPLYRKTMRQTKKYKAHDEENTCRIGDEVKIMETRPLSKDKCWRLIEILRRGKQM
ncbi:MAG: 30S ribosomal protein S17 [Desulfotomaculum sp.]|nr:30S ribosomal protein S17 [Desulfotomaculum sp.]